MGKLHELLAVEPDLKGEAERAVSKTKGLFTEGKGKFAGQVRTYAPLEEGEEGFEDEFTTLAATANGVLETLFGSFGRWMDAAVQKEATNCKARADVVVDGRVLFTDMPATALLNLEAKLLQLRAVYGSIPTNDPSEQWTWDGQNGYYTSKPRATYKTKKVPHAFVSYEATPEHPAQVETYSEDKRVGTWTTVIHSGMLAPTDKQERVARLDQLIRAVKEARQRANAAEVVDISVAETMFMFINEG